MAAELLMRPRNAASVPRSRWPALAALLTGCLFAAAALAAQEGQIFVRVLDQTGKPVKGVRVTSSRCIQYFAPDNLPTVGSNCREVERTTNDKGEAVFPSVRIGSRERPYEYMVTASKEGYTSASEVVTLHSARNEFPLTLHQFRSSPGLMLFEEAQNAAEAGDLQSAESKMAEALAGTSGGVGRLGGSAPRAALPPDVQVSALSMLADYRLRLQRYADAEDALLDVLLLDPSDRFALRTLVITAAYQQDWQQAEERAGDYLAAYPANADALLLMGNVYLETRRVPDAIEVLEQSELFEPEVAVVHRSLGNAYEMASRPQEAIEQYQRYLELAGDPPDRVQIQEKIARLR
ncbi:MAG: tetratricopeptide repeat protein [Acidobacteriota bacterium]|jgi:tetratricopeptide (TPR) repeat protein